ncbi:nucleotide-diphospho-sugar transferase [Lipomyces chichibuensis]|uniref:nucleotide-diphospho-sugar transferase n=1 Tax=Lipomyces chichibuensis TaxID=1546026 RepID=UPI003343825E
MGDKAYLTLLLTDTYLPGVLALAKALRSSGTVHTLAILIVPDALSPSTVAAVEVAYDDVIRVPAIANPAPGNLFALGRLDLYESFTKILAWNQTQYKRIVYLDADTLPLTNIDVLFNSDGSTAACPDAGWPDVFNSGVIVLTPSHSDFLGLYALADSGESFDGGDQGLLNAYFGSTWTRLPFLYNVTPTTGYQYAPAFHKFSRDVKVVHFIGTPKPWQQGKPSAPESIAVPEWYGATGSDVNNRLLRQWWEVYDTVDVTEYVVDEPVVSEPVDDYSAPFEDTQGPPEVLQPATPPSPLLSFQHLARWDPSRSGPPESSGGEAVSLPDVTYNNVWDVPFDPRTDPIFIAPPIERKQEYTPHEYYRPRSPPLQSEPEYRVPSPSPSPPPPPPPHHQETQSPSPAWPPPPPHHHHQDTQYHQPQPVWSPPGPPREPWSRAVLDPPPRLSSPQREQNPPLKEPSPPPSPPDLQSHPPPREPSPPPPPIFPWELLTVPPPVRVFPGDLPLVTAPPLTEAEPQRLREPDSRPASEGDDEELGGPEVCEDYNGEEVAAEDEYAPENEFGDSKEFFEENLEQEEDLAEELNEDEKEEEMVAAAESTQSALAVQSMPDTAISPLKQTPATSLAQAQRSGSAMVSPNAYNAWDRDPHILNYASHMSNIFFGGRSATMDAVKSMPISPAPLRRTSFFAAIDVTDDDDEEEPDEQFAWDPLKKLDELAKLPALLLARQLEVSSIAESDESTSG